MSDPVAFAICVATVGVVAAFMKVTRTEHARRSALPDVSEQLDGWRQTLGFDACEHAGDVVAFTRTCHGIPVRLTLTFASTGDIDAMGWRLTSARLDVDGTLSGRCLIATCTVELSYSGLHRAKFGLPAPFAISGDNVHAGALLNPKLLELLRQTPLPWNRVSLGSVSPDALEARRGEREPILWLEALPDGQTRRFLWLEEQWPGMWSWVDRFMGASPWGEDLISVLTACVLDDHAKLEWRKHSAIMLLDTYADSPDTASLLERREGFPFAVYEICMDLDPARNDARAGNYEQRRREYASTFAELDPWRAYVDPTFPEHARRGLAERALEHAPERGRDDALVGFLTGYLYPQLEPLALYRDLRAAGWEPAPAARAELAKTAGEAIGTELAKELRSRDAHTVDDGPEVTALMARGHDLAYLLEELDREAAGRLSVSQDEHAGGLSKAAQEGTLTQSDSE